MGKLFRWYADMSKRYTKILIHANNLVIIVYAYTKPTEIIHMQFSVSLKVVPSLMCIGFNFKIVQIPTVSKILKKICFFSSQNLNLRVWSCSVQYMCIWYIEHRIQGLFLFTQNFYLSYETQPFSFINSWFFRNNKKMNALSLPTR